MATTIEVNKQSVKQLLETGKTHRFVIPEYQRSYAWNDEQIQTLFDDLAEYTSNENESSYFLGTIVSYENDSGEQEIIDGQQRITSLLLLLRAIYTKLQHSQSKKEVENFKAEIEPAIWKKDKLTGEVNFLEILIVSRVVNHEGNQVFAEILETGVADAQAEDNYSKNYIQLQNLIDGYVQNDPLSFYNFIYNLLNQVILLPIQADSQDTALTIFSTLNDRGLPLSDADIFKAKIYNSLNDEEKKVFIKNWQELNERAEDADETVQRLFYYYMFYLRALDEDRKSTTPGLRKYYSQNNFERLYNRDILSNLSKLLNLWVVINTQEEIGNEKWSENLKIKAVLDSLSSYPNEFWKYPVSIYYLSHSDNEEFEEKFLKFLRRLFVTLASKYVLTPTINAVKTDIMNLNVEIIKSMEPNFELNQIDEGILKEKLKTPHRNTVRMLLKVLSYQEQEELLPTKWQIEHILPKKWQSSYFPDTSEKEVKEMIEHIGNKVPFERKLNIVAGNGYFAKKKQHYSKSHIEITRKLVDVPTNNWGLENIREKDIRLSDKLLYLFREWGLNNVFSKGGKSNRPTQEEAKQIEHFKEQGWL